MNTSAPVLGRLRSILGRGGGGGCVPGGGERLRTSQEAGAPEADQRRQGEGKGAPEAPGEPGRASALVPRGWGEACRGLSGSLLPPGLALTPPIMLMFGFQKKRVEEEEEAAR